MSNVEREAWCVKRREVRQVTSLANNSFCWYVHLLTRPGMTLPGSQGHPRGQPGEGCKAWAYRVQPAPPGMLAVQERRDQDQEKRSRLQQAVLTGQRIIVDLGFDDLMTDIELKSLAQQLIYSYSANTKSQAPCHLIFTDFQGRSAELLSTQSVGHTQWLMSKHCGSYLDIFSDRFVQLPPGGKCERAYGIQQADYILQSSKLMCLCYWHRLKPCVVMVGHCMLQGSCSSCPC